METSEITVSVLSMFIGAAPALLFWGAVIVFGAIVLGRGGGRAERFLIIGAAVGVLAALLKASVTWILIWMSRGGTGPDYTLSLASTLGIIVNIVSAAGIGFLIYAFWLKFSEWKHVTTEMVEFERGSHDAIPQQ